MKMVIVLVPLTWEDWEHAERIGIVHITYTTSTFVYYVRAGEAVRYFCVRYTGTARGKERERPRARVVEDGPAILRASLGSPSQVKTKTAQTRVHARACVNACGEEEEEEEGVEEEGGVLCGGGARAPKLK